MNLHNYAKIKYFDISAINKVGLQKLIYEVADFILQLKNQQNQQNQQNQKKENSPNITDDEQEYNPLNDN